MIPRPFKLVIVRKCGLEIGRRLTSEGEARALAREKMTQSPEGCRVKIFEVDPGTGAEKRMLFNELVRRLGPGGSRTKTSKTGATT